LKKSILLWSIILVIGLGLGSCRGCQRAVADYNGDVEEIWQVRGDGSKRISDYEWFYDKYDSIKSQKASLLMRINSGESEFKDLSAEVTFINSWIGQYNSRSKEYTRAMWKADSLPQQLELITSVDGLK
jgi:hypothetical protein